MILLSMMLEVIGVIDSMKERARNEIKSKIVSMYDIVQVQYLREDFPQNFVA